MTSPHCRGRRAQEIADTTLARLASLELDGLILYDIDDETERNPAERPFPFMPTLDPADYLADHLGTWARPVIVYRAVGKYAPEDLRSWLSAQDPTRLMTVLVGAASRSSRARTSTRITTTSARREAAGTRPRGARTATELMSYCRTLGAPFGIKVESVSIRRVEIEAAVRLARELRTQLER